MPQPIKILIAEDSPDDAELLLRELRRAGFEPDWQRVDTEAAYVKRLHAGLDLVLSDYEMPQFSGLRALELLKQTGLEVPFILVSGTIGEETAVQAMKQGAQDYLLKDRLARLGSAVELALGQARSRREQRQTEKELRLFRALLDQSKDAIEVIDPETGRYLDVNERGCSDLGYTRAEHLALRVMDIDPTITPVAWPALAERIRLAASWSGEGIHRRKNGTTFPVEVNAKWVRLDRDYLLAVVRDITERKRAEEVLAQASSHVVHRRRKSAVIELTVIFGLGGAFLILAYHFDWLVHLNTWMEQHQLGLWEEIVFAALIVATGLTRLGFRSWRESKSELTARQQVQAAMRLLHDELESRVKERTTQLADANNSLRVEIAEHRQAEIALRESEARFRQLAENIREVFWMTDPAKNAMLYVSPAYEAIWGRSCDSLYQAPLTWMEAVHPDDRVGVLDATVRKQSLGTYDETYRIVRPDGSFRWIRDRAFPVRDQEGKIFRIVGTAEDVTERKGLEEQFFRAQRMEAIGTLASGIAHDLNNILAPILMSAQLLRLGVPEDRKQKTFDTIEGSAQRGADLVRRLLTFGRGVEGERKVVVLKSLVAEMVKIAQQTFSKGITITTDVPLGVWPVLADVTQLHQVLLNLCVNARDAMPAGGTLGIRVENIHLDETAAAANPDAKAGPYVRLCVSDTGTGIPSEILDKIFAPFFTTKEMGKGTGLGLSTVIGIVKSHGGFVTLASEVGRGTTFKIHLPAAPGAVEAAKAEADVAPPSGRGELILVVDDEEIIRDVTRDMLVQHNYRVMTATDGATATVLYSQHGAEIDAVITDLDMPVMDGVALIRILKKMNPAVAVLVSSGIASKEGMAHHKADLEQLGFGTILRKPYTAQKILIAVHDLLKSAAAKE